MLKEKSRLNTALRSIHSLSGGGRALRPKTRLLKIRRARKRAMPMTPKMSPAKRAPFGFIEGEFVGFERINTSLVGSVGLVFVIGFVASEWNDGE